MAYTQWHFVTSAEYAAGTKIESDMYFLSDTFEIYRGTSCFTQAVGMYTDSLPANPALNRIYFNTTNMEGKFYDGTAWHTAVRPIVDTVTEDGADPVSGAAIAAYVASKMEDGLTSATVVKDVDYDSTSHKLTVTMGDDNTKEITLAGLGVSLATSANGSSNSIQLIDAEGNPIGDAVEIDVERFITGAEYDSEAQAIVMYFDGKTGEESTDKITIPVGDLVDVYTVEDTATVDLEMVANKITAAVKISAAEGNALVENEDGLYVAPVDTSDLMPVVPGATAGNIPILDGNGMLVDSGKSFEEAGKPNVFTGASIDEAVSTATPKEGDFCIVTTKIGETDVDQNTGYIYTNGAWAAMTGNYSAENVYFPDDLVATANIGVIKVGTTGQATVTAKGKNLIDVMKTIMIEKKNPSATAPSVTVSKPAKASYEVGTKITPEYSATLNPGKYTYGPATGITASSWEISDTAGNTSTEASGTFPEIQVIDDFNYRVTAKATYDASTAVPVTNTGEAYPSVQIPAGNKTGYSAYITGYRSFFYGSLTSKDAAIDSALVRGLAFQSTEAAAAGTYFEVPVVDQAMRIVFAYPQSIDDSALIVKDDNGMDANITSSYTCYTVNVEGADGYTAIPYKVYVADKGEPVGANIHKVTI